MSLYVRSAPLRTKILYVNVGSEADVVGQIPAWVIRVIVDYDVIGSPIPIGTVAEVIGSYAEVESAKPEAARAATADAPDMSGTDFAGEVSVLPGMVEMIMSIIAPGAMADPLSIGVNVRSLGMTGLVFE